MAADAIHYLAVFDTHSDRPLYLARQARIATVDQRMICYARDGGCGLAVQRAVWRGDQFAKTAQFALRRRG